MGDLFQEPRLINSLQKISIFASLKNSLPLLVFISYDGIGWSYAPDEMKCNVLHFLVECLVPGVFSGRRRGAAAACRILFVVYL